MGKYSGTRRFIATAATMATSASLMGCTTSEGQPNPRMSSVVAPESGDSNCATLSSKVRLISQTIDGGENAVSDGCAATYDRNTLLTIGHIVGGRAFVIRCTEAKPPRLEVETDGTRGVVNVGGAALQQFNDGVFARAVPTCPMPTPTAS